MFSQFKEEVGDRGGKGVGAVLIENGDSRAGMNNGVSKVYLRGREVEDGGDGEGEKAEGLMMGKGSPLEIMIYAY